MIRSTTQRKKVALAVAVVITLTALALWSAGSRISPPVFMALRWIGLAALVAYGCLKRTLTAWIFIAMLLGAEIGHDFPGLATDLDGGDCRPLEPASGRPPGAALDRLL